jgi:hypothetical protein
MTAQDLEAALEDMDEIELTTTGRVTGKRNSHPVWFVRQAARLYLLPGAGSDSQSGRGRRGSARVNASPRQHAQAGRCRRAYLEVAGVLFHGAWLARPDTRRSRSSTSVSRCCATWVAAGSW